MRKYKPVYGGKFECPVCGAVVMRCTETRKNLAGIERLRHCQCGVRVKTFETVKKVSI